MLLAGALGSGTGFHPCEDSTRRPCAQALSAVLRLSQARTRDSGSLTLPAAQEGSQWLRDEIALIRPQIATISLAAALRLGCPGAGFHGSRSHPERISLRTQLKFPQIATFSRSDRLLVPNFTMFRRMKLPANEHNLTTLKFGLRWRLHHRTLTTDSA